MGRGVGQRMGNVMRNQNESILGRIAQQGLIRFWCVLKEGAIESPPTGPCRDGRIGGALS